MKPFFYKSYVIVGLGTPLLPPNSTRPPSPLQEPWLAPRQLALRPPRMNSISWQVGTAKEDIPEHERGSFPYSVLFCWYVFLVPCHGCCSAVPAKRKGIRPPSPLQEPWLAPRQLALHPPWMRKQRPVLGNSTN